MKVRFIAVAQAPDYLLSGETVAGNGDMFDLSVIEEGGQFIEDDATRAISLRGAYREAGELFVTLGQMPPITKITYIIDGRPVTLLPVHPAPSGYTKRIEHRGGFWQESNWIDAAIYDPAKLYIKGAS